MLSASADQLGFTLTAEAPYSYGGRLWADEWVEIALDYKGDGAAEIPLFAETVPFGETTRPGHYSGQLSSPADIRLEFGEGACYQSSQIEDVQVTAEVVSSCALDE